MPLGDDGVGGEIAAADVLLQGCDRSDVAVAVLGMAVRWARVGFSSGKSERMWAPRLSARRRAADGDQLGRPAPGSTARLLASQASIRARPVGLAHRPGVAATCDDAARPAGRRQRSLRGRRLDRGAAGRRRAPLRPRGGRRRSTRAASSRPAGWRRARRWRRTRRWRRGRATLVGAVQVGGDAAHQVVGGRRHRQQVAWSGRGRRGARRRPGSGTRARTADGVEVAQASGSSVARRARRRWIARATTSRGASSASGCASGHEPVGRRASTRWAPSPRTASEIRKARSPTGQARWGGTGRTPCRAARRRRGAAIAMPSPRAPGGLVRAGVQRAGAAGGDQRHRGVAPAAARRGRAPRRRRSPSPSAIRPITAVCSSTVMRGSPRDAVRSAPRRWPRRWRCRRRAGSGGDRARPRDPARARRPAPRSKRRPGASGRRSASAPSLDQHRAPPRVAEAAAGAHGVGHVLARDRRPADRRCDPALGEERVGGAQRALADQRHRRPAAAARSAAYSPARPAPATSRSARGEGL